MSRYRRLPRIVCRLAHVAYGFLTAHAFTIHPGLAALMAIAFAVYEFAETIHDLVTLHSFNRVDFPDDEFAEYGFGMALYVLAKLLQGMAA